VGHGCFLAVGWDPAQPPLPTGNLGTTAQLHAIASGPHAPWIEIVHDPPVAANTNGLRLWKTRRWWNREAI
jgi:hypothetical protein